MTRERFLLFPTLKSPNHRPASRVRGTVTGLGAAALTATDAAANISKRKAVKSAMVDKLLV